MSQATSSLQMTLVTNADGNGNACLRTDGTNYYATTGNSIPQPFTTFAVIKADDYSSRTIIGSNQFQWYYRGGPSGLYHYTGSTERYLGTPALTLTILLSSWVGGNASAWFDGDFQLSGSLDTTIGMLNTGTLNLGSTAAGTEIFKGDIYMVGAFAENLSTLRQKLLIQGLSAQFQKAVIL
jgi:hypothetical protein